MKERGRGREREERERDGVKKLEVEREEEERLSEREKVRGMDSGKEGREKREGCNRKR